jgi:predicted MFS family arabinose efflux permease
MMGGVLGVLQVERTPDHARGRVLALQNTALQLAAPAGIGIASVVAEVSSPMWAGFAVCALWVVAVVMILSTRSLTNVERDERTDDAQ